MGGLISGNTATIVALGFAKLNTSDFETSSNNTYIDYSNINFITSNNLIGYTNYTSNSLSGHITYNSNNSYFNANRYSSNLVYNTSNSLVGHIHYNSNILISNINNTSNKLINYDNLIKTPIFDLPLLKSDISTIRQYPPSQWTALTSNIQISYNGMPAFKDKILTTESASYGLGTYEITHQLIMQLHKLE